MMSKIQLPHISEDVLELYAMGRLSESELEPVEEHLLVCHHCQDALQEADEFVRAIRVAARELEAEQRVAPKVEGEAGILVEKAIHDACSDVRSRRLRDAGVTRLHPPRKAGG